jgi:hypothetical protein
MHVYLAAEGAESEIVEKAALARLTSVGDVRLHIGDVQHFLNLRHADHVVVRRAPNLKKAADSQANEY